MNATIDTYIKRPP